ncbi:hypothetical protein KRX57_10395 [Weeksellaceae bacterium TAE3-ERU29]|nr:hypothetical protein [Weeksellaceae bacterium TAE3-ERU29]
MKLPIKFLLIFSLIINVSFLFSQENGIEFKPQKERKRIFVGIDIAQPIIQLIGEKAGYEATISVPVYKKWQAAGEVGYETNSFDESGWEGKASGIFAKVGANWVVEEDDINPNMNFYLGGRFAFSKFNQKIDSFLIQGYNTPNVKGSLPESDDLAVWLEPLVGARVPIRESNFYIDANARITLLLYSNDGNKVDPIAIPGFGKNNSGINFRLIWAIGYAF